MRVKSESKYNEMQQYVGKTFDIWVENGIVKFVCEEDGRYICCLGKKEGLFAFEQLSRFAGDDIQCWLYGNDSVVFESVTKNEIILEYEK